MQDCSNISDTKDYHPISILALSKMFERLVSHQLNAYTKDLAWFNDSIMGFRKGYSTAMTLLGIRDDIMPAMRCGEVILMVLTDYSKAFDTVHFKYIIYKMYSMGFFQNFLHWILCYLMGHQQFVQIDDMHSGAYLQNTPMCSKHLNVRCEAKKIGRRCCSPQPFSNFRFIFIPVHVFPTCCVEIVDKKLNKCFHLVLFVMARFILTHEVNLV